MLFIFIKGMISAMSFNTVVSKKYYTIRCVYICILAIALITRAFVPLAANIPPVIDSILFNLLAICGGGIILLDLFTARNLFKTKYSLFYVLFLVALVISCALNRTYGLKSNFNIVCWMVIQLMVLYSSFYNLSKETVLREIKIVTNIFSVAWFFGALASFVMFLFQIGYTVNSANGQKVIPQGLFESRLFGVYADPNYAAIISVVIVIFCLFNLFLVHSKWLKAFYIVNIVLQGFYITLSGSRTAYVSIIAMLLVGGVLCAKKLFERTKLKNILAWLLSGIIAVSSCIVAMVGIEGTKKGLEYLPPVINSVFGEQPEEGKKPGPIKPITLNREDVGEDKDISNNRFKIWKAGLDLFSSRPVFGTSPRNMVAYAQDKHPENYIAIRGYMLHNGYLDVLVSTGVVGTIIMLCPIMGMLILVARYFFGKKRKEYKNYRLVTICLLTLLPIVVSTLFLSDIYFTNTCGCMIFWLFCGYLLYFIFNDDPALDKGRIFLNFIRI